ncbi:MAG: FmdE family protein [Bacillota bacterium]
MCMVKTPWERVVEFHGHVCPGLTIGFRAAEIALRELGVPPSDDEALVAIVENDACGVDAVQVLTGCTFGKGNLIFLDHGKQVVTIARRQTGEGVRVALNYGALNQDEHQLRMMQRMMQGQMDPVEQEEFFRSHRQKAEHLRQMPEEELFTVRRVNIQLPPRARIFPTVKCSECGEGVMEPRARLKESRVVCSACFKEYKAPVTGG